MNGKRAKHIRKLARVLNEYHPSGLTLKQIGRKLKLQWKRDRL